jgi:hypothetical protein
VEHKRGESQASGRNQGPIDKSHKVPQTKSH